MQSQRRDSLVEDEMEAPPQLPLTDGRYFACRGCRRILSEAQWFSTGCVECSARVGVPDRDNLSDFATPHFHNFVGLIAPGQSWVARLIMKNRTTTNGIFAETLSDDEDDVAMGEDDEEEEEDEIAQRYRDEPAVADRGTEDARMAVDFVDPLRDYGVPDAEDALAQEPQEVTPAPVVSSAPVEESTAEATEDVDDAADELDGRKVKRVKVEADAGTPIVAADDTPDAVDA